MAEPFCANFEMFPSKQRSSNETMNIRKNLKKSCIFYAGITLGLSLSAQDSEMIAGWDFSGYSTTLFPGFSSLDGATLTGQVDANFSQNSPAFDTAGAFGTLYYDGSFTSTSFDLNAKEIEIGGDLGTLASAGTIGASGNIGVLEDQGQQFGFANGLGLTTNGSITFAIDMTTFSSGPAGEGWSLVFAAVNASDSDDSSSIAWDYSLDGQSFTSTGLTTEITDSAAAKIVDLSAISELNGQSQVFFRANFLGVDDGRTTIDNFQVTATPMASANGSLFILENQASTLLVEDWYATPMGELYVGSEPWLWSPEYGWMFSRPENTTDNAFVYIQDAPFQSWIFVDQSSATADGFWGYAYDAFETDVNGWFWFFNDASRSNADKFFLWDNEGTQLLTFDDE
jgi:hypothetical protein